MKIRTVVLFVVIVILSGMLLRWFVRNGEADSASRIPASESGQLWKDSKVGVIETQNESELVDIVDEKITGTELPRVADHFELEPVLQIQSKDVWLQLPKVIRFLPTGRRVEDRKYAETIAIFRPSKIRNCEFYLIRQWSETDETLMKETVKVMIRKEKIDILLNGDVEFNNELPYLLWYRADLDITSRVSEAFFDRVR